MEFLVGEHAHFHLFANASREDASATNVLVTEGRVHIQFENDLEGFVEAATLGDLTILGEHLRNGEFARGHIQHGLHGRFGTSFLGGEGTLLLGVEGVEDFKVSLSWTYPLAC